MLRLCIFVHHDAPSGATALLTYAGGIWRGGRRPVTQRAWLSRRTWPSGVAKGAQPALTCSQTRSWTSGG